MKKLSLLILAIAAALLAFAACAGSVQEDEESGYALYFLSDLDTSGGGDAIAASSLRFTPDEAMSTEDCVRALMELLLAGPDEATLHSPIPEGTALRSLSVSGRRARVDLSAPYARLSGIDLSLADYCITLTLSQLPNVNAVSITANGVNALKGSLGSQYMVQTVMQTLAELRAEKGLAAGPDPIAVQNRYNPTLEYRFYMIPALMIMLLIMICGFLPALNLVGEKEKGTIEQINVTPVDRFTFTLAKLVPYWVIGLVLLAFAMLLAWVVYGLVPMGSFGAICLAAALFILTMSGIGVVIANNSDTMQQAMFVMFFFVMLFVLMSGLVTPVESMPGWAQWITRFLPPRYFVGIMRAVYLKGTTFAELWGDYAVLAVSASVFGLLAALTYRKRM